MKDAIFDELKILYRAHGYRLYLVGGSVRDLLLGRPYTDHDFATDALPEEEKAFLPEASYAFAKYGSIRLMRSGEEVDITTLRQEGAYKDFRHPSKIAFVVDPALDFKRRDFTINALYLDEEYHLLDFCGGYDDLKKGLIRFIGDPDTRLREDPLRLLRAERFSKVLGFEVEEKTKAALERNRDLLKELKPEKIKEEQRKLLSSVK